MGRAYQQLSLQHTSPPRANHSQHPVDLGNSVRDQLERQLFTTVNNSVRIIVYCQAVI